MKYFPAAGVWSAVLCGLLSCNGIFGNIYDTAEVPDEASAYGFIRPCEGNSAGRIYIDARSYTQWVYLDFDAERAVAVEIDDTSGVPAMWDIAIHRYDARTNEGQATETSYGDFAAWTKAGCPVADGGVSDIWSTERIMTDLSGMLDSVIVYAPSFYNPCLSHWLDVDLRIMPPIYTPSNRVYTLRFDNGKRMALRLVNYMNDVGTKGYMTIDYIYPVQN